MSLVGPTGVRLAAAQPSIASIVVTTRIGGIAFDAGDTTASLVAAPFVLAYCV